MSNYKHCCVVNADGYYQTFVLVTWETNLDDSGKSVIHGYAPLPGETMIDALPPVGLVKPKWQGNAWKEAATAAEIAAWEKAHPAPPVPPPTAEEHMRADIDYLAALQGVTL